MLVKKADLPRLIIEYTGSNARLPSTASLSREANVLG
jgi:hypothetical protein